MRKSNPLALGLIAAAVYAMCCAMALGQQAPTASTQSGATAGAPDGSRVAPGHSGRPDRCEGATHRVLAVSQGDLAMAPGTGRIPDVGDPRARVLIGRVGGHVARTEGTGLSPLPEAADRPQRGPGGPDDPGQEQGHDHQDRPS